MIPNTIHNIIKLLIFLVLFVVGSVGIMSPQSVIAQSCRAGEQTHVIANGQTIAQVAAQYGVPVDALTYRNGIGNFTQSFVGQVLCIPLSGTSAPAPQQQTATTTTALTTSPNTVEPGHENWCMNGGPWDDGRCIVPGNPSLQDYWFLSGWCNAQAELGQYPGTAQDCLNGIANANISPAVSAPAIDFGRVDDNGLFGCTIIYNQNTGGVTSLAKWEDDVKHQDQVIFFTDLPGLFNYAVNVGSSSDTVGTTNFTDPYKTFSRASAKLEVRDKKSDDKDKNAPISPFGIVDCVRIVE